VSLTPKYLGFRFPAEWEEHDATWLTWPYRDESFPGKLESIYPSYMQFIKQIASGEKVKINVPNGSQVAMVKFLLDKYEIEEDNVELFIHPSNDVWCRDHGPVFLTNSSTSKKVIVNWIFNAWGDKYPYDLDKLIPFKVAGHYGFDIFKPGLVLEGGSVDCNGKGKLITTSSCLLNKNRNPHMNQSQIEQYLSDFYCADQIFWIKNGIEGDDTDGHIDDVARFINEDTIVAAVETDKNDSNYLGLKENLKQLKKMRLLNGKQFNTIEIPMPEPVYHEGKRLPASYTNFYFSNDAVIVPTYKSKNDDLALSILSDHIKDRKIIGIDSVDLIWGFGSFHCLSQQEPIIPNTN
jgi:agmatine deiminase